jgi:hypothetical protein
MANFNLLDDVLCKPTILGHTTSMEILTKEGLAPAAVEAILTLVRSTG